MIIKRNDAEISDFLNKYSNYNKNIEAEYKDYYVKASNLGEKHRDVGSIPSEFEIEALRKKMEKRIEICKKETDIEEKEITRSLKSYSQEMLVSLYMASDNKALKGLIKDQIIKNNNLIDRFNNLYLESGEIFEVLNNKSSEIKNDLLNLRENDDEPEFDGRKLLTLAPKVKDYIFKSINGNLEEEKKMFCEEKGLTSELEFEFYKNNVMNNEALSTAREVQEILNNLLHTNDSSLIEKTSESLRKTGSQRKK